MYVIIVGILYLRAKKMKHRNTKVSNIVVGCVRDDGTRAGGLGCHKQVQNEREEADRVCCGFQMDDVKLILEWSCLHGSKVGVAKQKCLWTVTELFHIWCEPEGYN